MHLCATSCGHGRTIALFRNMCDSFWNSASQGSRRAQSQPDSAMVGVCPRDCGSYKYQVGEGLRQSARESVGRCSAQNANTSSIPALLILRDSLILAHGTVAI